MRNPNYGRSPRLAGASHSPQAAPTSPQLAPFTSLTNPQNLTSLPDKPPARPAARKWPKLGKLSGVGVPWPRYAWNGTKNLCHAKNSAHACQQPRRAAQPRRGDRGIRSRTGSPYQLDEPRHLAILAPQGDQGSHPHFLPHLKISFLSPSRFKSVGND